MSYWVHVATTDPEAQKRKRHPPNDAPVIEVPRPDPRAVVALAALRRLQMELPRQAWASEPGAGEQRGFVSDAFSEAIHINTY